MNWKMYRLGCLALAVPALLLMAGCTSDDDLIASGNVVATMPTSGLNASQTDFQCIRIDYRGMSVRPTDGICSIDSDRPGDPCGADRDCTNSTATCLPFDHVCVGGADDGQTCLPGNTAACPGGICSVVGECFTLGGTFTGQSCVAATDCDVLAGERCGGVCSPDSPISGQPCLEDGDCTLGDCEGAQIDDTIESNDIVVIAPEQEATAYFTSTCMTCELDRSSQLIQFCQSDLDCENLCLPADQLGTFCPTEKCCQKFDEPGDVVTPICTQDSDCTVNHCIDSSDQLPPLVLPEGRYNVTRLATTNMLLYSPAPGADRDLTTCTSDTNVALQFEDNPLNFTVGPNRSNAILSIVDIAELEQLLGSDTVADCLNAVNNYPEWFSVTSD